MSKPVPAAQAALVDEGALCLRERLIQAHQLFTGRGGILLLEIAPASINLLGFIAKVIDGLEHRFRIKDVREFLPVRETRRLVNKIG